MSEETKIELLTRVHQAESEQRRLSVDETLLRKEFAESGELQAEFSGVDAFIALRKREIAEEQRTVDRSYQRQIKDARREERSCERTLSASIRGGI